MTPLLAQVPEETAIKALHIAALRLAQPAPDPVQLSRMAGIIPDPWQETILRSQASRILMLASRQSGKSSTAATIAVHTALYEPKSLILLLSPGLRQSGELFRKALGIYRASGQTGRPVSESALQLELPNGSRIVSLPGKEGTIRGYSGVRLIIIDEAAWVADELYASVRPMLAVSQGRLIALSTPHGTRGWFYDAYEHGGDDWLRTRVTAYDVPRITPAFLADERRGMGEFWFSQEYECVWLDSQTAAFREADIQATLAEEVEAWQL